MPIHVTWDNDDQTIIRWDFDGLWDWEMVYAATGQSVRLREGAAHSVSVILNMERATPMKPGALNHTKVALAFSPDNRDLVVVVGRSHFVQTMVDLFRTMNIAMADKFFGVETLGDARRLIASQQAGNGG